MTLLGQSIEEKEETNYKSNALCLVLLWRYFGKSVFDDSAELTVEITTSRTFTLRVIDGLSTEV